MSIFKYCFVSFARFHQFYQAVVVSWIKMSLNYYLAGICSSKTVILKEFNSAATRTKNKIKQEDLRFVVYVSMGTLSVWPSHVSNAQKTWTTRSFHWVVICRWKWRISTQSKRALENQSGSNCLWQVFMPWAVRGNKGLGARTPHHTHLYTDTQTRVCSNPLKLYYTIERHRYCWTLQETTLLSHLYGRQRSSCRCTQTPLTITRILALI